MADRILRSWNARIEHKAHIFMPSPLSVRRSRSFCPNAYSSRHKAVVQLAALGVSRRAIATQTGYSAHHVSKILRMPAARRDLALLIASDALSFVSAMVRHFAAHQ